MAKVKVKFFAIVFDATGVQELDIEVKDSTKLKTIKNLLLEKYPLLKNLEKRIPIIVLVNGENVSDDYTLRDGDEIAFLPPAAGG